ESFTASIKAAFQPPHYQQEYASRFQNLLGQIDRMHKADKVMYFTEGLKSATKAEVNYHASETLDDVIKVKLGSSVNVKPINIRKESKTVLDKINIKNKNYVSVVEKKVT
ncbi:15309_t:CDS:2, partial [Cetraspora pellucida]